MADYNNIPEFIFTAGFSNTDLLKYGDQGVILNLEDYIQKDMPNLSAIFEKYPEYKTMCTDPDGHIWGLPWIEQLGSGKEAIQTVGGMGFINKKWLDALSLSVPTTTDELEKDLIAFRDNADKLQKQFSIDGSIIPMSFMMSSGNESPSILINGFGEGYGDPDIGTHIAVTDDKKAICMAVQDGYQYYSSLSYTVSDSMLRIDRTFSGSRRDVIHHRKCRTELQDGILKLRVILDLYSAEVFVDDGSQTVSAVLYTDPSADRITFFTEGIAAVNIRKYDLSGKMQ